MEDQVFNPDKVKRTVGECDFGEGWYDYDVVEAEDYDKLLALYRAALKLHEEVCEAQGI